jgi:hypothetical protein
MVDFGEVPERERNFVRRLFTDPRMRSLYPEWEELVRSVVSYLRMEAARKPDDPRLAETRRRPLDQGRPVPPLVGRHPRRRQATRHSQIQPSRRRRDHARLGRAHLRRRARPAARRLHRGAWLSLRARAARARDLGGNAHQRLALTERRTRPSQTRGVPSQFPVCAARRAVQAGFLLEPPSSPL